ERRLLQDISHELRSPLARLSFAVELARTSSDRNAAAERANREIDRLTSLVESLLQVTRAEDDAELRNMTRVDFGQLIGRLIEDCRFEAQAVGCELQVKEAQDIELLADRELLRRAIENVIRNAIRHAPHGTKVEIE